MPHFLLLLKENGTLPTADDLRGLGFAVSTAVCPSSDVPNDQQDPTETSRHMPSSPPDPLSSALTDNAK